MNLSKLRFKADDGSEFPEWEEKKLGDIWKRIIVKNDGSFGGDKIISVANMKWAPKDDVRDDYLKTYNLLPSNAIAFEGHRNNSYSYGRFVLNDIGDGIVSHVFVCFEPIADIIPAFWKEYIHAECVMGRILRKCTKSSTMMHDLVVPDFLKQTISVPSLPEQKKISSFLSTIDEIIQSTESELTAWQERKKGVMQKIFNREVRFKADNGSEFPEWEEKRLGEVVTLHKGHGLSKGMLSCNGDHACILYGELYTIYGAIIYNVVSKTNDGVGFIGCVNDVLMPASDVTPKGLATASCLMQDNVMLGGDIHVLRPENKILGPYLSYAINADKKKVVSIIQGNVVRHTSKSDLEMLRYNIPSLPEQQKIADCLLSLDNVINQIQAELSAWKKFKKGLLQQMFV